MFGIIKGRKFKKFAELVSTLPGAHCSAEELLLDPEHVPAAFRGIAQAYQKRMQALMVRIQSENDKVHMINEIIHSGLWTMYFDDRGEMASVVWSDQFRSMLGYHNTSDFPNTLEAWSDKIHEEDKANVMDLFGKTLADKTNRTKYDVNYRLKVRSGEYRWYRAAGNVSRRENGTPSMFIGIFVDITEQQEKERELAIKTQRHDAIDSTLSEGSWSMNVVGRNVSNPENFFWWSQQFRNLLGYQDERDFPNVLNSWSDKLHPEDKQFALDAFSNHVNDFSGRTPYDLEYRLQHKNGEYRWFRAVGKTVREKDGTPIIVAGSVLDITDSKRNREVFELNMGRHIDSMATGLSEIAKTVENATAEMMDVAAKQNDIVTSTMQLQQAVSNALKIIDIIQSIANQTKLLSLNASIESARVGEMGKGFAAVATEVRSLATNTNETSKQIAEMLEEMNTTVNDVMEKIVHINGSVDMQNASMEEINVTIEELNALSGKISEVAKNLFK